MGRFLKTLFFLVLVIACVGVPFVFADSMTRLSEERGILSYVVLNDGPEWKSTAISATSETAGIIPGKNRVVGFEVGPVRATEDGSRNNTIGLHDGTASTACFGETEAPTGQSAYRIFPYPKEISNQVTLRQGPYTYAIVYYERYRP